MLSPLSFVLFRGDQVSSHLEFSSQIFIKDIIPLYYLGRVTPIEHGKEI